MQVVMSCVMSNVLYRLMYCISLEPLQYRVYTITVVKELQSIYSTDSQLSIKNLYTKIFLI